MAKSKFYEKIKSTTIERQVEDIYNAGIAFYFKDENGGSLKFEYPYACDGLVETKTDTGKLLKLLMEYKFNMDFTSKTQRAKVITQVLFYMKRFENDGLRLPNVVLAGDKDECFVFHSNDIIKYLDYATDWKTAPSLAADANPDLVMDIANDENMNPFVFVIDENFNFSTVAQKIKDLADNVKRYVHVTEHNISTIYDLFINKVIKNQKKIKSHDLVGIFMGVITNGDAYYQHPAKKNILVTPMGNVDINGDNIRSFFDYFQRTYTPQEKNNLTAIADRLIEDTDRRKSGDFWTPTLFVDYAHKMISEQLGENWKDEYVVWDNCCGAKNLTRDYKFKELYCSTLFDSELKIGERYNKEAISFQFDFLNDNIARKDSLTGIYDDKLPKGLKDALLENKPIVFFLNPPYAKNSKIGANGLIETKIQKEMKNDCGSSATLHIQFLYRIMKIREQFNLTNCYIALFCKPILSQTLYKNFRKVFLKNFKFIDAILFNSGEFADVSSSWGISFTLFKNGIETQNEYEHKLVKNNGDNIIIIGNKKIYNTDTLYSAKNWYLDSFNKHTKNIEIITGSHPIYFKNESQNKICQYYSDSIGGFCCSGNNLAQYGFVDLLSVPTKVNNVPIFKESFNKFAPYFAVRKLIETNWIIDKDEYLAPNEKHPQWQEFVNDSIIYSIFSGNQSSLRNINLHNKLWDIKNEFFWMSKSEIESLANTYNNDDCYNDVHTSDERFVYQKLQEIELSPEAQAVLDKASEIVRKTFKYRQLFNEDHPEYQINNWDCGWYQIKALAKEYAKEDLEEFKKLYKALSDKMRPMVYELGFLKK